MREGTDERECTGAWGREGEKEGRDGQKEKQELGGGNSNLNEVFLMEKKIIQIL